MCTVTIKRDGIDLTSLESSREKEITQRLLEAEQKYQEERRRMVILEQKLERTKLDSNEGQ